MEVGMHVFSIPPTTLQGMSQGNKQAEKVLGEHPEQDKGRHAVEHRLQARLQVGVPSSRGFTAPRNKLGHFSSESCSIFPLHRTFEIIPGIGEGGTATPLHSAMTNGRGSRCAIQKGTHRVVFGLVSRGW